MDWRSWKKVIDHGIFCVDKIFFGFFLCSVLSTITATQIAKLKYCLQLKISTLIENVLTKNCFLRPKTCRANSIENEEAAFRQLGTEQQTVTPKVSIVIILDIKRRKEFLYETSDTHCALSFNMETDIGLCNHQQTISKTLSRPYENSNKINYQNLNLINIYLKIKLESS